jgi:hypothetical protein
MNAGMIQKQTAMIGCLLVAYAPARQPAQMTVREVQMTIFP